MTRPIEAVVAEAQRRLESSGRLDVDAFISAYPEHAGELKELLPVMAALHTEKLWQQAEANSCAFAASLFDQLTQPAGESSASSEPSEGKSVTLGDLFARERARAALSLEEQARKSGLPVRSLELLAKNETPLSALSDNTTLKRLAAEAFAPFGALVKEVRRLLSLDALSGMTGQAVFTREKGTSSEAERQALLEQVKKAACKPPEEKPRE